MASKKNSRKRNRDAQKSYSFKRLCFDCSEQYSEGLTCPNCNSQNTINIALRGDKYPQCCSCGRNRPGRWKTDTEFECTVCMKRKIRARKTIELPGVSDNVILPRYTSSQLQRQRGAWEK